MEQVTREDVEMALENFRRKRAEYEGHIQRLEKILGNGNLPRMSESAKVEISQITGKPKMYTHRDTSRKIMSQKKKEWWATYKQSAEYKKKQAAKAKGKSKGAGA
jgi:hypothetical protein